MKYSIKSSILRSKVQIFASYLQSNAYSRQKIILESIAKVVKNLRKKQNKSQRILAFEYEIQKSLISRIESASNSPLFITICMLAEAFGMKVSEFVKLIEKELPKDFSLID